MARTINKLTALAIKNAAPGYHSDGGNLWLQVAASGAKSWIFRFDQNGKRKEMGLGALHTVALPEARQKAKDCRSLLLDGKNPIDVRKAGVLADALERSRALTFIQCATAFIAVKRHGWKSDKHADQWTNTIEQHASAIIGHLPVAEIDTALVMKVLEPIWTTKTETATRLRGRIESVLDWARVKGYRIGENPARWRGHLDKLLPKPGDVAKVEHHPALAHSAIGAFIVELRKQDGISARAVEFAILTAARSGEVRGATWSEVDLDGAKWTIPAERMKMGVAHEVPLSPEAVDLLKKMPVYGHLVFHGAKEGKRLSDMSMTAVLRRMGRKDITVHGFRSTFRDWCAESTTFPREVAEYALAHKLPDKVEAAYQRGTLLVKRIAMMKAWAKYCGTVRATATVTSIDVARAAAV